MKKIRYILWGLIMTSLFASCEKEGLWNQNSEVSKEEKGRIIGQLLDDETGEGINGVKILMERQTSKEGGVSYVDTISTHTDGTFSYEVPFPNKVRLVVRDTGRYVADTAYVDVLERKDYDVSLSSLARFGKTYLKVRIQDELENALTDPIDHEYVKVALLVRESSDESYSPIDTLEIDENGEVLFDDIAFPVNYKATIVANPLGYRLDSIQSRITDKNPEPIVLSTERLFKVGSVKFSGEYFFTGEIAENTAFTMEIKSFPNDEFVSQILSFDNNGEIVLPEVNYPAEIKILANSDTDNAFRDLSFKVSESYDGEEIYLSLFDVEPRFSTKNTPSPNASENTLTTFYDGVNIRTMEVDDKGNVFAVTRTNDLIRIPFDGSEHTVLSTDFEEPWGIALENSNTVYVVENQGLTAGNKQNKVKKVAIDPKTDEVTITVVTGKDSKGGANGSFADATFSRPAEAVYDSKRDVLWLTEWEGPRVRKIDFNTQEVSTFASFNASRLYGMSLSGDQDYLFVGSFQNNAGIHRFDLETGDRSTVVSGGDIRHLAATPDNKVFYSINKEGNSNIYQIPHTGGTRTIAAGNNTKGLPSADYSGAADVAIASGGGEDFVIEGLVYDAFSGRLYFSAPLDKRLYYIKLTNPI